jgi:microcystin-dependent protein
MSDPFLGEIRMVGFTFAPYGWALCQGQTVPITQNQALFALLGTTYGGNGTSNFNLPDLQGRSPVGTGTGAGLTTITPGDEGGQENASLTINNLPTHTHVATVSGGITLSGTVTIPANSAIGNTSNTPGPTATLGAPTYSGHDVSLYSTNPPNTSLAPINVTLQGSAPSIENSMTGNSMPVALRNPYLGLTCIIALQGLYPTRG